MCKNEPLFLLSAQVFDARALRVIVDDANGSRARDAVETCYKLVSTVHSIWKPVPHVSVCVGVPASCVLHGIRFTLPHWTCLTELLLKLRVLNHSCHATMNDQHHRSLTTTSPTPSPVATRPCTQLSKAPEAFPWRCACNMCELACMHEFLCMHLLVSISCMQIALCLSSCICDRSKCISLLFSVQLVCVPCCYAGPDQNAVDARAG